MKGTLNIYRDGGLNGQPSPRSIGVWWLLHHALIQKHKVEIFMIYQNEFDGQVKGLFGLKNQKVSVSYKHIELSCLADYFSEEGRYPSWNLQENHEQWNTEIETLHAITKENKGKKTDKILNFADELKKRGHKNTKITRCETDYNRNVKGE